MTLYINLHAWFFMSLDLQCILVCFVYDLPNALLVNLTFQLLIINYFIIILHRYPNSCLQQCNSWEPCTHARTRNNTVAVWAQSKPVCRVVLRPITHITLCKGSSVGGRRGVPAMYQCQSMTNIRFYKHRFKQSVRYYLCC